MLIPTHGRPLAHPVCSWLCRGTVHALVAERPVTMDRDALWTQVEGLGVQVVEVLPGPVLEAQPGMRVWVVRVRVKEEKQS